MNRIVGTLIAGWFALTLLALVFGLAGCAARTPKVTLLPTPVYGRVIRDVATGAVTADCTDDGWIHTWPARHRSTDTPGSEAFLCVIEDKPKPEVLP